jgi:hypothetical protein
MIAYRVFPFSNSCGVLYYAVADWSNDEAFGNRRDERCKPVAKFEVGQRHRQDEQLERAGWFCEVLNKQLKARAAVKLEELA